MDNRRVVPYNPYLTLKYNAHINVEVSTSLQAIKCIYKYIFQGFDCANIAITSHGQQIRRYDEISNYVDYRYISAPEAMWRILKNPVHENSHTVMRLEVHLPDRQRIMFEEGNKEQAVTEARPGRTKLEGWFDLNEKDDQAQQHVYTDIPKCYIYVRSHCQ